MSSFYFADPIPASDVPTPKASQTGTTLPISSAARPRRAKASRCYPRSSLRAKHPRYGGPRATQALTTISRKSRTREAEPRRPRLLLRPQPFSGPQWRGCRARRSRLGRPRFRPCPHAPGRTRQRPGLPILRKRERSPGPRRRRSTAAPTQPFPRSSPTDQDDQTGTERSAKPSIGTVGRPRYSRAKPGSIASPQRVVNSWSLPFKDCMAILKVCGSPLATAWARLAACSKRICGGSGGTSGSVMAS